jgi:hypothetical protein
LAPRRAVRPAPDGVVAVLVLAFGDAVFLVTLFASVMYVAESRSRAQAHVAPRPDGSLGPSA